MMPPKGKSTKTLQWEEEEAKPSWLGEGTWILSYICRVGLYLGVQILNFNIWRGVKKVNTFLGGGGFDENLYFLGGPSQNWTIFKHSRAL